MEKETRGQNKFVSALIVGLIATAVSFAFIPAEFNPSFSAIVGPIIFIILTIIYSKFVAHKDFNLVWIVIVAIVILLIEFVITRALSRRLYDTLALFYCLYIIISLTIYSVGAFVALYSPMQEKVAKNPGTQEIIMICICVVLSIAIEYLVVTSGSIELTWIGAIFGFIAIYMGVRLPGTVLKRNFIKLGNFGGMTYEQIAAVVGPCNSETPTVMGNGDSVIVRQWIKTGYHISLVFKDNICIGKNHEAQV